MTTVQYFQRLLWTTSEIWTNRRFALPVAVAVLYIFYVVFAFGESQGQSVETESRNMAWGGNGSLPCFSKKKARCVLDVYLFARV